MGSVGTPFGGKPSFPDGKGSPANGAPAPRALKSNPAAAATPWDSRPMYVGGGRGSLLPDLGSAIGTFPALRLRDFSGVPGSRLGELPTTDAAPPGSESWFRYACPGIFAAASNRLVPTPLRSGGAGRAGRTKISGRVRIGELGTESQCATHLRLVPTYHLDSGYLCLPPS